MSQEVEIPEVLEAPEEPPVYYALEVILETVQGHTATTILEYLSLEELQEFEDEIQNAESDPGEGGDLTILIYNSGTSRFVFRPMQVLAFKSYII